MAQTVVLEVVVLVLARAALELLGKEAMAAMVAAVLLMLLVAVVVLVLLVLLALGTTLATAALVFLR
jgi:hypothetical protein